jgi:hypothetical protein
MSTQQRVIKLSVRGLAKYIVASPAAQRRVLEDFKYAAGDEPFAMRTYYREVKDCIKSFHRNAHPADWLRQQATLVSASSHAETGTTAQRLEQNARAIRQYEQLLSGRRFEVLDPCRFRLTYFDVSISVVPDLHIREGNKTKLYKIQFGGPPEKEQGIRVMTQCLLEAANVAGHGLPHTSVIYLDLPRGLEHHAPRSGAKTLRDIKAACQTISQLWDSIQAPNRSSRRSGVA